MSREEPMSQETSLERISNELETMNGLLRAYLTYTASTAIDPEELMRGRGRRHFEETTVEMKEARVALKEAAKE